MKGTTKKRIKLKSDGLYYPQYRWFFIWRDYIEERFYSFDKVIFASEWSARKFLNAQLLKELGAIERAANTKVIECNDL